MIASLVIISVQFLVRNGLLECHRARGVGGSIEFDLVGDGTIVGLLCDAVLVCVAVAHVVVPLLKRKRKEESAKGDDAAKGSRLSFRNTGYLAAPPETGSSLFKDLDSGSG